MITILICGLGNPSKEHQNNRHNIGFKVVDFIASKWGVTFSDTKKFLGHIAHHKIGYVSYILCKPNTYMNASGQSVAAIKKFYAIDNDHIWVIHDELDLSFNDVRVKKGGGHAGHNGLKSIDAHIGNDYHRIRVGIGRPSHKDDVTHYVLSDFVKSENVGAMVEEVWNKLRDCLEIGDGESA